MTLAERLKNARESLGKNQKEISALLGISKAAWQGYEAGENIPGGQVFESLTKLGFNGTWLLTGEGEMKRGEKKEQPLAAGIPAVYNVGDVEIKEIVAWLKENPGDKKAVAALIKLLKTKKEYKEALESAGLKGLMEGG